MAKRQGIPAPTITVPDPSTSKFAKLPQYAVGMGKEEPNSYLVCVPYFRARSAPIHGDKVHVRRTRTIDQRSVHEDTLRVVKVRGKKVRLECQQPAPKGYKGRIVTYPSDVRTEKVEIRGLVIGRLYACEVQDGPSLKDGG